MEESKRYKCSLCSTICNCKADLKTHLFHVHKKKINGSSYFKCELCDSEFAARSFLERHVVGKHVVDKAFECPVCSKTFIDQPTLDKHITSHDTKLKYFCDICSNGFKHKRSLVHHLGVKHLKSFYCDKCSRSFRKKSEFDQHSDPPKTSSSELKLKFKCQICNESFDSHCTFDAHTNNHLKAISSDNPDEINNLTNSTKNLNHPMPILTDAEKLNLEFQCELCSKVFDRQSYLQAHKNLVHPNADWTCNFAECAKTFKNYYQLRLHKLKHVSNAARKPFVCRICQKSFHTPESLKQHGRTHAQDNKHKCCSCPQSFARGDNLRSHVANQHGGPKPFECPVLNCGKSSANRSFLKGHLVTHQMNSKAREAVVFICSSKKCSFESVSETEVAIHYSEQHGLPKIVVSPSHISSKCKDNNVSKSSSTSFGSGNASSEIKDAEYKIIQVRYKCRFCKSLYPSMQSLQSHRRIHSSN